MSPARILLAAALAAAPAPARTPPAEERRLEVSPDLTVVLSGEEIHIEARPVEGETPVEFARRISRDPDVASRILTLPGGAAPPRRTVVSYSGLSDEAKRAAITALFPSDVRATAGWLHIAVDEESLTAIATWFTGSAGNAQKLGQKNGDAGPTVSRGTTLRIPAELLLPPFRDAEALDETEPVRLTFGEDEQGRYAVYRLRKKEALYSAVVVRFTGRIHAPDVLQTAVAIAERSGIGDVHAIPVGYPVKIPLELLAADYLPRDDPRARARALEKAETAQFAQPVRSEGLGGVRVVIDAGHGGRDTGTIHGGLWEATYVYDVACRLRRILTERTLADVVMTTRDPAAGWKIPDTDRLPNPKARLLLTSPPYPLDDPVVGVSLRWYLANSLLKRPAADRRRIPPERTVFISLHADSLHPSLRGAMAYVPGERFLRTRYGKRDALFAAYREFREEPVVSFNQKERMVSEGASTALAEKLIAGFRGHGLPVHPFSPVRTHVIRGGREWVPAVLRYNRIPNRVLLEIANLANEADRALIVTRRFRQEVAEAVAGGLLEFFGGEARPFPPPALVERRVPAAALLPAPDPPADPPPAAPPPYEIYGPVPESQGPVDFIGPWPEKDPAPQPGRATGPMRARPRSP